MSARDGVGTLGRRQRFENSEFTVRIYPGALAEGAIYCPISARKTTTAAEAIEHVIERLQLNRTKCYVLAEVKEFGGEEWILNPSDCPVQRMMLWPRVALEHRPLSGGEDYRFLLRQKNLDGSIHYGGSLQMWLQVTEERRRMVERGLLPQPESQGDHADLCRLPELNECSLLDNLRSRFRQEKIYTYVGSILIVINPFKFLPIYNPKYVKMYDNHTLGDLEPHIYAVADVAYHTMLQRQRNQCIVISGESGSGKTQSTNFLIHHLTALSQKGFASGVEQIILGAGPVLEAFGNAKTAHNNNSSRFGKFIQVNYQERGTVRGAYVEKYLLEKSRLVYQEHNERNYHVFYYLLAGASEEERTAFHLKKPEEYHYLSQDCFTVEGEDLKHDFERLQLAMEMVGFLPATRKQIFSLLSAILHLGNICYKRKTYRDDSIDICNPEVLPVVSELLEVKEEMLFEALTTRKTVTVGEKLIVPYKLAEAGTVRDSMAKSLYSALFDWIVFRINHALINIKDLEDTTKILSIGVLDIFGFEDYENNSFEQFCINFANERLQHYFNQHIFKLEQEEYRAEGISWRNIDYIDNTGCINLISKKPTALFHLLDEECNFPQATNQTLLDKFKRQHEGSSYIDFPAVMEPAFIIRHYAGKVKYGVKDFREKNTDHMRPDIVALLKSSKNAFICGLIGIDPSATFRWAILRAYFRALVAFREAGKRQIQKKTGKRHCTEVPLGVNTYTEKYSDKPPPVLPKVRFRISLTNYSKGTDSEVVSHHQHYQSTSDSHLQHLLNVKSLKYLSNLTLHDRITKSLLHLHKKKKPPSISAQFQASLNKLMETLGQSEPYFVKCIRSNAEKLPLRFNDNLVLRQLRYTGMLETVRIRQSGYNIKYSFKDFVHHFCVLLPEGTRATREGIQQCLGQLDLKPDGYQVGRTMVFLREAERQRLQALLHREVLRLIVMLQRQFRAQLERKQFVRMREAAICIQDDYDPKVQEGAAVCLQAYWRGYRERQRFTLWREAALVLQRAWRLWLHRRCKACLVIQTAWRCHQARQAYLQEQEPYERIMGLDLSTWEDRSFKQREKSLSTYEETAKGRDLAGTKDSPSKALTETQASIPMSAVVIRERERTLDELSQRTTRAKRESRRMRELEQAKFSLELLKVRTTSGGASSPSEERRWSVELVPPATPPLYSPQGTPDSQSSKGSFELFSMDGDPPKATEEVTDSEDACSPLPSMVPVPAPEMEVISTSLKPFEPLRGEVSDGVAAPSSQDKTKMDLTAPSVPVHPPKVENYLPTFYVPANEGSTATSHRPTEEPQQNKHAAISNTTSTVTKPVKEQRGAMRKPVEEHNGHIFRSTQYSIPTYCEFCSSLIWMMDRAYWSLLCTCVFMHVHSTYCICVYKQFDPELSSRQFGVEVSRLTNDERTVPLVVEKLINYIEMHGLYTEGIYRKSGSTNKIKELKQGLDTDVDSMNLDDYNIHVIASVFKQWLRDLPNPLMTFELYEEFIRAMGLKDKKEMIRGVYSVIDQLSRTHLNTLERLIFHLVRIALQEDTNRMSANALAIVFAPCILRCPDTIDPLQSVQDISKTTACVELIICEQMKKYKVRLKDINTLEFAENKAKCRLTLIRRSMVKSDYIITLRPIMYQKKNMFGEKKCFNFCLCREELTFEMLTLESRASDDETLESEASIGTADSSENLNVDSEGTVSDFSGMS
uniref:Myosin IXA n=1 Tax=Echeneis naucrates TaxID=173247 RepID=A0A665V4E0_ECHNA